MRLGIMQPYFMPYIGYISLIKHTDEFILFDPVQFIRHGWIERNRTLKPGEGWQYIQVPLEKHDKNCLIREIRINNKENWKQKMLAQLQHYKKTAPYYFKVTNLLKELFEGDYPDIVSLNKRSLEMICAYLDITTPIRVFSEMDLQIEEVHAPDEWALNICKAIEGADEYWNPPGGQDFFDRSKYEKAGISLKFQTPMLEAYDQKRAAFEAGLSIIDVLMFNSPEEVNRMLDQYTIN